MREAVRQAEAVADGVERVIHAWWRDLLRLIRNGPQMGLGRLQTAALHHCRLLPHVTRAALSTGLVGVWKWGAERAARRVPVGVLRRVYARRYMGHSGIHGHNHGYQLPSQVLRRLPSGVPGAHRIRLPGMLAESVLEQRHGRSGVARLTEDRGSFDPLDYLFGSGGLDRLTALPEDPPDDLLRRLVLPVPSEAVVRQRVERLIGPFVAQPRPDLVSPERMAATLVQSYAAGKDIDSIAEDMLPVADGVRASARRVARTWGVHVANESQFQAHEQLGDAIIGYRLKSARIESTRWWHRDRHDQVYLRNPGPGEKGFAQMPRPPMEPADPSERPAGTSWLAWSCL